MVFWIEVNIKDVKGDNVWNYVAEAGETENILQDEIVQKRIFTNINTLHKFMQKCEDIYGDSLIFSMNPFFDGIYMIITDDYNRCKK